MVTPHVVALDDHLCQLGVGGVGQGLHRGHGLGGQPGHEPRVLGLGPLGLEELGGAVGDVLVLPDLGPEGLAHPRALRLGEEVLQPQDPHGRRFVDVLEQFHVFHFHHLAGSMPGPGGKYGGAGEKIFRKGVRKRPPTPGCPPKGRTDREGGEPWS